MQLEYTCFYVKLIGSCVVSAGASIILAELAMEAGLPKGVLNIVHGTNVRSTHVVQLIFPHTLHASLTFIYSLLNRFIAYG